MQQGRLAAAQGAGDQGNRGADVHDATYPLMLPIGEKRQTGLLIPARAVALDDLIDILVGAARLFRQARQEAVRT